MVFRILIHKRIKIDSLTIPYRKVNFSLTYSYYLPIVRLVTCVNEQLLDMQFTQMIYVQKNSQDVADSEPVG